MPDPIGLVEFLGTTFGSSVLPGEPTATFAKAFDGDLSTYFVGESPTAYCGRDLGVQATLKRVRVAPQIEFNDGSLTSEAAQTLRIRGSNAGSNTSLTQLFAHTDYLPWFYRSQLTPITIENDTPYR